MKYEIVATLGPNSEAQSIWEEMLSAGVTAFRLNTSHLSLGQLHAWLERLDAFFNARSVRLPVVLDLQGSKWRLGSFTSFDLISGERIELLCAAFTDRRYTLPVPHPDFFKAAAESGKEILLNDAKIRLSIESVGKDTVRARVVQGGGIMPGKAVTLAGSKYRKEALNEKDQAILEETRSLSYLRFALSFVRDAAEMARYRALIGKPAYLIAKLERQPAVEEAAQIATQSNELWLCRGDLGAEVGAKVMAEAVHRFGELPAQLPCPILMAGQVFEHLTLHPTPTRSEVCYLYDTLERGYRGLVLSDETAIGRYPVEACRAAALFLG